MLTALATAAALAGLAAAAAFAWAWRRAVADAALLRARVRELADRAEAAEKAAAQAESQAEMANAILLEQGIADEGDLGGAAEDERTGDADLGADQPSRGGRTVH